MSERRAMQRWTARLVFGVSMTSLVIGPALSWAQNTVAAHVEPDHMRDANVVLARPMTIALSNVPLRSAIDSIARIAKVAVQYRTSMLDAYSNLVNMRAKDVPLGIVLERALTGTQLRVVSDAKGDLAIVAIPGIRTDSTPSVGTITGRVSDSASGRALVGATVKVAGTKISALTTDSGLFVLHAVPVGDQLLMVRTFGYRQVSHLVTVAENARSNVHIRMSATPTILSGVVTTATGMQRKVTVGNDITTLNVDSIMQMAPVMSVTDLLETRVPGLTVLHASGEPGAPSRIRIRGASTINGNNDPIVIVDGIRVYASQSSFRNQNLVSSGEPSLHALGVASNYSAPSPLDQIDPNSIATLEVFKGPSASALYGSDAANGVIVITTKRGRAGPTHWDLIMGTGVNWLPGTWPTNYYKFGRGILNDGKTNPFCAWNDVSCHLDSLVAFQALNDPRYTVLSHGSDNTAALTVSGGMPTVQYSLTGSAARNTGNLRLPSIEQRRYERYYGAIPGWMVRPDNYRTWGMNGQLIVNPASHFQATIQSSMFDSHQQTGSLQLAITQLQGIYIDTAVLTNAPLIQNDVERATDHQTTSTNALNLQWQPYRWLPITATGGRSTIERADVVYIPYGINNQGVGCAVTSDCGTYGDTTGYYGLGRGTSEENTLSISTMLPARILTLGIGANLTKESTSDITASTNELAPGVTVPTAFPTADNASSFGQSTASSSTYGWYLEPRLNLGSRLFVSPGFRLDGGSASGANAGLTNFPKIDVSYLAVEPGNPRGLVTLLRPRLAFGYAGTQPGPTQKLRLLGSNASVNNIQEVPLDGSTFVPVVYVNTIGNTLLRPERSRELEGGVDLNFWQDHVQLTYTWYNKTRSDAIIAVPVAPSVAESPSGVWGALSYQQYFNVGQIRNTGTEVTANLDIVRSRALGWTVGANLSNNKNVVARLNPGQSSISSGNTRVAVGYPLWGTWALPIVSYADSNQNGVIDPSEIRYGDSAVFVGQSDPKYQLNFNTVATLFDGRLSVNASFAYQNGFAQFNSGALTGGQFALLPNAPGASLGMQAGIVAAGSCLETVCQNVTNIGLIQTVNTLRFQSLSVNYNVPSVISSRMHLPRMSIALQGENLGLHTNYRGKDPDVNVFSTNVGNQGDQTADAGQIPAPRTWWLKLSLGN